MSEFNVKSNNWYCCDKSCLKGDTVDDITRQFGFRLVIKEPKHTLDNISSCIDLVFTSQLNLTTESGTFVFASLLSS